MNENKTEMDSGIRDRANVKAEIMEVWRHIGHSMRGNFSGAWMELNLSIAQLKCLFYIDAEGSSNQKSIAAVLGVTPPNVTGIIDRLVEQQLVTRHENESDRRMQVIALTPKSTTLLSELKERRVNHLGSMLEQLSMEDLQALRRGLKALYQSEIKQETQPDS